MEIPSIRFARTLKEVDSLFRPLALPKPHISPKDFLLDLSRTARLREHRVVNTFRHNSLFGRETDLP